MNRVMCCLFAWVAACSPEVPPAFDAPASDAATPEPTSPTEAKPSTPPTPPTPDAPATALPQAPATPTAPPTTPPGDGDGVPPVATTDAGQPEACQPPKTDAAVPAPQPGVRQPQWNPDGSLVRPTDAEEWVFMGSGVNLNYVDLKPGIIVDVLTVTLMEPSAYRHFRQTGEFAEGTMTVLMGFVLDSGAPPAEHGQYPGERLFFEMSVKDSGAHGSDTWGYYDFGPDGQRATAKPPAECNACHAQHAQTDFVFTQFYPFMRR